VTTLRITAGTLRGRRLPVPPRDVRPTSERARQAYFNIVGPRIQGARFLDLFAGTGAFSFEAVSRGAASAVAVDTSRKNIAAIEEHAKEWNVPVTAIAADVLALRHRAEVDLVYADPPYDFAQYPELLEAIARLELTGDALVAVEHRRRQEPFSTIPPQLLQERTAEYGEVWMTFFRRDR